MIELSNGCICCSTNSDLLDGSCAWAGPRRSTISWSRPPASPIRCRWRRPSCARNSVRCSRLDAIVAMADAEQFSLDLFDGTAARPAPPCRRHPGQQMRQGCRRAPGHRRIQIRAVNAEARMMRTTRSVVPLPLILDVDLFRPAVDDHGHHHDHLDDDGFESRCPWRATGLLHPRFPGASRRRPAGIVSAARASCGWPRPASATSSCSAAAERGRSPLPGSSMVAAAKPSAAESRARATSRGYILCSPPGWPTRISGAGADAGVHRMPGISSRVNSRSRTPSSRRCSEVNRTIVPFGSAPERRSRTTYRPTVTPEGSTHVDTFTGTTSSVSRTASGKVAVVAVLRQQVCGAAGRRRTGRSQ